MAKPKAPKAPSINAILARFYGSMLTPAQMRKQARRETNLAMQDSMRQLRTTMQREREQLLRQQYAQGAWSGLLRGFGAEGSAEAQSIRDAYARAAGLSQAESGGFIASTTGQQAANVAQGQAAAENLAGYTGDIQTAIPGGANASTNAMVLNYLNSLPAGTFGAQAEAAAKGLGRAGAEAGSQFAFQEAALGQELRDLRDEYSMAVQDLQAKRPGLLQEALSGLRESGRGDFATLINALYLQNTLGRTEAELTGTYKGRPTQAAIEAARDAALEQQKLLADIREANEGLKIRWTNAETSRMRANIAKQQLALDRAGAAGDLVTLEQDFRTNVQSYLGEVINVDPKRGMPKRRPPSRQALINAAYRIYGKPLAGRYGLTKKQLAQWIRDVVSTFPASYWRVGGGGTKPTAGKGGSTGSGKVKVQDLG